MFATSAIENDCSRGSTSSGNTVATIWLEPARATLGYGQVDILLTAAVLYDLSLPDTARRKGMLIGLVAGLKLTPAIFAVYLLVTGRRRAAAIAAAAAPAFSMLRLVGSSIFASSRK